MKYNTVKELKEALEKFPDDMPIRIRQADRCRSGEFFSVRDINESHLRQQNTDGDPSEYWNAPDDLDEEDKLKEGDIHFKYQGRVILIS